MGKVVEVQSLDYLLSTEFMPDAAAALTQVNIIATQLRAIPDSLLTSDLREQRTRVLNDHLPELLVLHRAAREAGSHVADSDLAASLEPVSKEITRLLNMASAPYNRALREKGEFLHTRFDDQGGTHLENLSKVSDKSPDSPTRIRLPKASVSGLVDTTEQTSSKNKNEGSGPFIMWLSAIPIGLSCLGLIGAVQETRDRMSVTKDQVRPNVTARIVEVTRRPPKPQFSSDSPNEPQIATVKYEGTVKNVGTTPLNGLELRVSIYACENISGPLSSCTFLDARNDSTLNGTVLRRGVTARFARTVSVPVPDALGSFRATVSFGDASYGDFAIVNDDL